MPWITVPDASAPEQIRKAADELLNNPPAAGGTPFHKLSRQQLLTLAIALQDQRDKALAGQQKTIGYVVVGRKSKQIDWDLEMHPLRVDAINSLTGPYQKWCRSVEEETEDRTYWGKVYMICPVLDGSDLEGKQ